MHEQYYGLFYLSRTVPDALLAPFGGSPPDASSLMLEIDGFDYGAMTFYSILGDLYYDFGYYGSALAAAIIIGAYVFAYNRAAYSQLALAFTINFSVSLLLLFAVNRFMGMGNILGFALFVLLCVSRDHLSVSRTRLARDYSGAVRSE